MALARTLLARPRLLLMDEPTSAMDAQTEAQFLEHLHRATKGQTLVLVTHRPSLLNLVDRVIVMDNGRVVADGPKANVLTALGANANGEARAPAPANANAAATATAAETAVAATARTSAIAPATARTAKNGAAPAPTILSAPTRVRQAQPQQQEAQ